MKLCAYIVRSFRVVALQFVFPFNLFDLLFALPLTLFKRWPLFRHLFFSFMDCAELNGVRSLIESGNVPTNPCSKPTPNVRNGIPCPWGYSSEWKVRQRPREQILDCVKSRAQRYTEAKQNTVSRAFTQLF
jgi:hypothetical protein